MIQPTFGGEGRSSCCGNIAGINDSCIEPQVKSGFEVSGLERNCIKKNEPITEERMPEPLACPYLSGRDYHLEDSTQHQK